MSHQQNITRIKVVFNALGDLAPTVVFVGGATVSLYSTRPNPETRPTDDVDIVVEVLSYGSYAVLEENLRRKGFENDVESGIICRYIIHGIVVDVMPTAEHILGFSNIWYNDAYKNAQLVSIDENQAIQIFSPPYFLATKLEAFKQRGSSDGRTSTDFEDIVHVLNNRQTIWEELQLTHGSLKNYLTDEFKELLNEPYIDEWISSHLDYSEQKRVNFIIGSLTEFVEQGR